MNSKWSLDNFDIELTKTDEGVLIRAEYELQGYLYTKLLNHESVKSIFTDQFFDLETLYQLLKDYLEKKPENTSLSISDSGKLHYSCQILFGSVVKKFEFDLQLEKQELDALTRLENQVNKLSAKMLKFENEKNIPLDAFQNFEKTILEKFGNIEEILARTEIKMAQIEEKILERQKKDEEVEVDWKFNLTPELQTKFKVTNDSKTASSLLNSASSILARQSLPKGKISKFTFLIGKSNWIMVGIALDTNYAYGESEEYEKYQKSQKYEEYHDPVVFAYSNDGQFFFNSNGTGAYSQYKEGDRVSFICDMETGKIQAFLNNNLIGNHEISKQELESNIFYPYLYTTNNVGIGATFI